MAFPSYDEARGPRDPAKLQHRHPCPDWTPPVPPNVEPLLAEPRTSIDQRSRRTTVRLVRT